MAALKFILSIMMQAVGNKNIYKKDVKLGCVLALLYAMTTVPNII
jgi:hypothetical protein